jgi:hypothetical protein
VQVVARLESGDELVALQRRAGDERLEEIRVGDRLWIEWSPTAALLLGPVDAAEYDRSAEPLEVQA